MAEYLLAAENDGYSTDGSASGSDISWDDADTETLETSMEWAIDDDDEELPEEEAQVGANGIDGITSTASNLTHQQWIDHYVFLYDNPPGPGCNPSGKGDCDGRIVWFVFFINSCSGSLD